MLIWLVVWTVLSFAAFAIIVRPAFKLGSDYEAAIDKDFRELLELEKDNVS